MTLQRAIAALLLLDREAAHLSGRLFALVPAWAALATLAASSGPLAALLVWAVGTLRLAPEQDAARAARLMALLGAVVVGLGWAVAWAAGLTGGVATPPTAAAASATAPLGGAVLALALGSGRPGARTPLLGLVAWFYLVGRVAAGVDGPLQGAAEVLSALAVTGLCGHVHALRDGARTLSDQASSALGLRVAAGDA